MSSQQLITGEVIDTSFAYTESTDAAGNIRPKGTIIVRTRPGQSPTARPIDIEASPFNIYDYNVPLIGEHVTIVRSLAGDSNVDRIRSKYYYTHTVNVLDNINSNIFKNLFNIQTSNQSNLLLSRGIRSNATPSVNSLKSFKVSDIASLQPFEGDRILQSRNGSVIRFTSTVLGNLSTYNTPPTWTGLTNGDPMLILSNGIASTRQDPNRYAIEDINKDNTSLYLTSTQQVNLTTAQPRLAIGILPITTYTKPQLIANSSRIVLNSSDDSIILNSKRTVSISTPKWAMDMDKFFTQVETMQNQLTQLTAQVTVLTNLVSNAAISDIPGTVTAASLGIVLPGATAVSSGTPAITSQLSNITAQLSNVTATLATLKQ